MWPGSQRRLSTRWSPSTREISSRYGLSPTTVAFLHALGHDMVHLADQGLERLPDSGIVGKARQEGRIVLVYDFGFGELVAASGATLPSVIICRRRNVHPDRVNGALQSILSQHGEALSTVRWLVSQRGRYGCGVCCSAHGKRPMLAVVSPVSGEGAGLGKAT